MDVVEEFNVAEDRRDDVYPCLAAPFDLGSFGPMFTAQIHASRYFATVFPKCLAIKQYIVRTLTLTYSPKSGPFRVDHGACNSICKLMLSWCRIGR